MWHPKRPKAQWWEAELQIEDLVGLPLASRRHFPGTSSPSTLVVPHGVGGVTEMQMQVRAGFTDAAVVARSRVLLDLG